ncbi:cysteine proteinase mucunain isoform X2 [Primulina huaijiensis]|uniref:cysteine proteinase mucunain isoform X2 n=1 Tax=Primulina huaijiensis TaxID=1492673 RepID=UPI003CC74D88
MHKIIAHTILFFCFAILAYSTGITILKYDENYIANNPNLRSENHVRTLYEWWLAKHGKTYNGLGEKDKRFDIFKDNLKFINEHNAGNRTYEVGLNRFADLSNEEYRFLYLGTRTDAKRRFVKSRYGSNRYRFGNGETLPESVDWRKKGAVAPIKNQGSCGSCWAFSTVAAVESINQIATGKLITLSEQELVDCDKKENLGCNGGLMDYAFQFIMSNGGMDTEDDYPYKGVESECDFTRKNAKIVSIDGYEDVPQDEKSLRKAVAHQPVSVAIEASGRALQLYTTGVFTGECGTELDHGVVVVGYGTEKGVNYWIVRNSWGTNWGEDGYFRLERSAINAPSGKCGIVMEASYPIKNAENPTNFGYVADE